MRNIDENFDPFNREELNLVHFNIKDERRAMRYERRLARQSARYERILVRQESRKLNLDIEYILPESSNVSNKNTYLDSLVEKEGYSREVINEVDAYMINEYGDSWVNLESIEEEKQVVKEPKKDWKIIILRILIAFISLLMLDVILKNKK